MNDLSAGLDAGSALPRVGLLATVRNRRGVISSVEPFDGSPEGRLHTVTVEYIDSDGSASDVLLWEREPFRQLLEPTALPDLVRDPAMGHEDFEALVRATRWSAISPFLSPEDPNKQHRRLPLTSPLHGAIQVDDFQLVPVVKALRMPRISILLADDVGLGKTIEAGLILSELLLRRRIRRVLIICPASLTTQWRGEMKDRFSLSFDYVNREETHALRRRFGLDANPWRMFPRIVASYYYLKQPDVLEQFMSACKMTGDAARLPWDLLIVDEAHNLTPAPFGEDSDLSRMLGLLAPHFEHKLFLTATPHNGHTRSFSGLLERLDPVRFTRTSEFTPAERSRVEDVLVRRLKSEINERTNPPRFCNRTPRALRIRMGAQEHALSIAFEAFRKKVHSLIAQAGRGEQLAGAFAVEVLGKRLLSCPVVFGDTWVRYKQGLGEEETADAGEVRAAERTVREETGDDREAEGRTANAAQVVGAWLKPLAGSLVSEIASIDRALEGLGLGERNVVQVSVDPTYDCRFDVLVEWVDANLRTGAGTWRSEERVVVFTEYKTTLDYLTRRLTQRYGEGGAVRVLFGGMDDAKRDAIKAAFNDPADPVRILVATDAASEGLNLQQTARFLIHYDVPWNPARLEQRNGRLDRHGQARDVTVHHFDSDDDGDTRFLAHVVEKVHTIREDLGSTGEVFEAAFEKRLVRGESSENVRRELEVAVERAKGRAAVDRDKTVETAADPGEREGKRLQALAAELDLDAGALQDTLDVALGIGVGRPRLEAVDNRGRMRLRQPVPSAWEAIVDDCLRLASDRGAKGALPALVFDAQHFIEWSGGRPVFRPQKDTALLHLGHPFFHRTLSTFARARFAAESSVASRWTVRRCPIPTGLDAVVLLTVEELAVNELRETFHHWVRTLELPVRKGELLEPLPHRPAQQYRRPPAKLVDADEALARDLWDDVEADVRQLIRTWGSELTARTKTVLEQEGAEALKQERERFQSRQGEVSALIEKSTLQRLERELAELAAQRSQGVLFDNEQRLADLTRSEKEKEEELSRRRRHYEELREQLARERDRVMEHIIPRRYAMRGSVQVFPVAVEVRLPGEDQEDDE